MHLHGDEQVLVTSSLTQAHYYKNTRLNVYFDAVYISLKTRQEDLALGNRKSYHTHL